MIIFRKIYSKIRIEIKNFFLFLKIYVKKSSKCYLIFSLPKTGNRTIQKVLIGKKENFLSFHYFFENLIEKRRYILPLNYFYYRLLKNKMKIIVITVFRNEIDLFLSYVFYKDYKYKTQHSTKYLKKEFNKIFFKDLNYKWSNNEFKEVFKFNPLIKIKKKI